MGWGGGGGVQLKTAKREIQGFMILELKCIKDLRRYEFIWLIKITF